MILEKYTIGVGDRFAHQGKAQLQAMIEAKKLGIEICPVWNKSHREHTTIKSEPAAVREEADQAVSALEWKDSYYVDADHISIKNVDLFIESSNFFTIDIADFIGKAADESDVNAFVERHKNIAGSLEIDGIDKPLEIYTEQIKTIARKILLAVKEASKIYRRIESAKGRNNFITEISMDETDLPQTPIDMLFILTAIADNKIPIQTIAPKFIGRLYKGIDYTGDVARFAKDFEEHIAVIAFAVNEFGLAENLKLSIHSGSDKFSIYGPINKALKKFDAGLHLKTVGTTWLEELTSLALAGGDGLKIVQKIYEGAVTNYDELCASYATVIDIDKDQLPSIENVKSWTNEQFANSLRNNQTCPDYNPNLRQLLHVGYKIAALMGDEYLDALKKHEQLIAKNVTENILERHIKPVFI
jgi:hypothetical protein